MTKPHEAEDTRPGTREARRERISRTTASSAVASAAVQLTNPALDVEKILARLFDIGREQGRLQNEQALAKALEDAANAKERATRYSMLNTEIRGVAKRLRDDGVVIPADLGAVIWPNEVG